MKKIISLIAVLVLGIMLGVGGCKVYFDKVVARDIAMDVARFGVEAYEYGFADGKIGDYTAYDACADEINEIKNHQYKYIVDEVTIN